MKKFLFGILAVITVSSLVACGQQTTSITESRNLEPAIDGSEMVSPIVTPVEQEEEQIGVGNTDEGMVALVLEQYLKGAYDEGVVEEVVPVEIKVYTPEEIAESEVLKDYTLNEGDIVFEAHYEMKINDEIEDLMQFTAATGEIDGHWIREKYNVGIARNNGEDGYSLDAFGTAF